ncbi:MAG: M14 family metallopeptidase [Aurantibacter sp.]
MNSTHIKKLIVLVIVLSVASCSTPRQLKKLRTHAYINPVDTRTVAIEYQARKVYQIGDVGATNNFPGARLNNFGQLNDSTYFATIDSENEPINPSPWYAFKVWSEQIRTINVMLGYGNHKHRYYPKLSADGEHWEALDSTLVQLATDSVAATIKLKVGPDTLWVAAQEIQDSKRVAEWVGSFDDNESVTVGQVGKSGKGRPLLHMNITKGGNEKKPAILVISRQHPPEVTGFFAMKSFIETVVREGGKNGFLEKYRVMVYPLMNPDGVDLGHYRHGTGGVDLNRDWSVYHQPEIAQVTKHMVEETKAYKNNVLLGLDFHSTYHDVYYTPDESVKRKIPDFTKKWLASIKSRLDLKDINESPGKGTMPTSSAWFNRQFGATGITYEIGDGTPREFIKLKGEVSARAMMEYFLE